MKKIFLGTALILIALIAIYRDRVFLRDPLGTVYRNEAKVSGVQVFINSENDVLLLKDSEPDAYRVLLQHWDMVPGAPMHLTCVRWTACMTEADHAPIVALASNAHETYGPKVTMTDPVVVFVNGDGAKMRVTLR
jgi:hypothetical protein